MTGATASSARLSRMTYHLPLFQSKSDHTQYAIRDRREAHMLVGLMRALLARRQRGRRRTQEPFPFTPGLMFLGTLCGSRGFILLRTLRNQQPSDSSRPDVLATVVT